MLSHTQQAIKVKSGSNCVDTTLNPLKFENSTSITCWVSIITISQPLPVWQTTFCNMTTWMIRKCRHHSNHGYSGKTGGC